MVPDGWEAVPAADLDDARAGSWPRRGPEAWRRMDGSIAGMSVTWVDATQVGVPSDFYYLAANGPVLSRLTQSKACRAETRRVLLDNRPSFGVGKPRDGDYMAKGQGTCNVRGTPTRWAYFVAAPGFGPVRRDGDPVLGPLRGGGGDARLPAGAIDPAAPDPPHQLRRRLGARHGGRRIPSGHALAAASARVAIHERRAHDLGLAPPATDVDLDRVAKRDRVGRPQVGQRDPRAEQG